MPHNLLHTFPIPNLHNMALIGKQLPYSSFVEFDAFKLKNSELTWLNTALLSKLGIGLSITAAQHEILDHYAYVSSDYTTHTEIYKKDKKRFLADRYGSLYESASGGSSRCGMNGQFQIKGIGRNPLVLADGDYNHSHGKLYLAEAVNEAIWGEICHQHLPYGAVRTLAIIKTPVLIRSDYGLGKETLQPCALAIREPSIRPAHFERATFFWPEEPYAYLRDTDYVRVQETIAHISTAFEIHTEESAYFTHHDSFNRFICFAKRIARQIGVSRVKGIPHGSLTSANISIDGRFLDFGTISSAPNYANYILAAGQGGVWDDHLLIAEWMRHLFFYVNKYSAQPLTKAMQDVIIDTFLNELEHTEDSETAKLIGIQPTEANFAEIGTQIKQALHARCGQIPRPFVGFQGISFADDIEYVTRLLGLHCNQPNIGLRDPRYSQHTIAVKIAELVQHTNGHPDAVTALIHEYISIDI